jgi:hypothetical protein
MRSAILFAVLAALAAGNADEAKVDPHFPFRTDWANAQLPWYQLKPGEFPPHHSDHRVGGELVACDFIHRTGTFRMDNSGVLVDFTMPPFGSVYYLNAEADLRDVPLGTFFLFFVHQDEHGAFTRMANMEDEYTMLANHGFAYHLDEVKAADHKLLVTKRKVSEHDAEVGKNELLFDDQVRIWKGGKQLTVADLAVGDDLLVNVSGNTQGHPRRCTDIWIGRETHAQVTEAQRQRRIAFLKMRGLPAWIDSVDGKKLTVTFFSNERASLMALFKDEGIVPAQWASEHRRIEAVVANDELRSYNPPVDKQGSTVLEARTIPADCYGSSGEQWVIEPDLLLEGFRKGRIIRLFVKPSWPIKDMPFGEGVYDFTVEANDSDPHGYPYRTDDANASLPWYQVQPGAYPPNRSDHRVDGELVALDAGHRSGRFRTDRTGALVDFTLLPSAAVVQLGADTQVRDLMMGTRYQFSLYQDAGGAFTRVGLITDDYSRMALAHLTYRIDAIHPDQGWIAVSRMTQAVTNYNGDQVRPPELGRSHLAFDAQTAIWKGDQRITPAQMTVGDEILVDCSGRTATDQGRCTGIWVGADTVKSATEAHRATYHNHLKESGMPAWIDSIDGKRLTISFFAGVRGDFPAIYNGGPHGGHVAVLLADERLHTHSVAAVTMAFRDHLPEGATAGTYGCSGIRWVVEPDTLPEGLHPGSIIRVFKEGWTIKGEPEEEAVSATSGH